MAVKTIEELYAGGMAPVLSYNVPEPTSYAGRNLIELRFGEPSDYFKEEFFVTSGKEEDKKGPKKASDYDLSKYLESFDASDYILTEVLKKPPIALHGTTSFEQKITSYPRPDTTSALDVSPVTGATSPVNAITLDTAVAVFGVTPEDIILQAQRDRRPHITRTLYGGYRAVFVPKKTSNTPRIVIVEEYRYSSYLGAYGAGRTLQTFSLLPGEKHKITIKTYRRSSQEEKEASSIFDSFSNTSAIEFQKSVESEQSDKSGYQSAFSYHAEASADFHWGWGNAEVSGGVAGSTNSTREEFANNLSKASSKHAAAASAKRDIQINTSTQNKTEAGYEETIERTIENINVARTLNFVYRQMNQEFISILHLIDIRIAFTNGLSGNGRIYKEYPLHELDILLKDYVLSEKKEEVKQAIISEITNVYDYKGDLPEMKDENGDTRKFIEHRKVFVSEFKHDASKDVYSYFRVNKDFRTPIKDIAGVSKDVPGVVISVDRQVLRTDGVVVEALIGQSSALDPYSQGLQDASVATQILNNAKMEVEIDRIKLAIKIVEEKDKDAADIFERVFKCCPKELVLDLNNAKLGNYSND